MKFFIMSICAELSFNTNPDFKENSNKLLFEFIVKCETSK